MRKKFVILAGLIACLAGSAHAQLNMTQLGRLEYTGLLQILNDIWGWADGNGNEYALVGKFDGTSIVDVTDPANPTEVFFLPGPFSSWRDLKTWDGHVYVTNEADSGLTIIDLNTLPGNPNLAVTYYDFLPTGDSLKTAHNLYIDENGICYLFGSNIGLGGAIMLDLNADPKNPQYLGMFDQFYLHDGMVRGDTLWGSAINDGFAAIIDVSDKTDPILRNTFLTPNAFTHNSWISDDNDYLFTTDEVGGAYVTAYDVSNVANPTEVDRYQSNPGSGSLPHNTHVYNNYLVTSYYVDGVTIVDATRPDNMVEVGNFDTAPDRDSTDGGGCWGAYPYLPSGNILATDMQEGLFVLGATYVRASYLQGAVTDAVTNLPVIRPDVELVGTTSVKSGDITGEYRIGHVDPGSFTVRFSKSGYVEKLVNNVVIGTDSTTILDVELSPWPVGVEDGPISTIDWKAFPNPFSGAIRLELDAASVVPGAFVRVRNQLGQVVAQQAVGASNHTLTLGEDWPAGLYIAEWHNGNQVHWLGKWVKVQR
ncbi:MAG: choice-of-anchor B family protein [Bacteroidota bacterium]